LDTIKILVTNGGGQCPAKTLQVKVNNIVIGQLGTAASSSQVFTVGPGENTVVVVADFNNNTSAVVYGPKTF